MLFCCKDSFIFWIQNYLVFKFKTLIRASKILLLWRYWMQRKAFLYVCNYGYHLQNNHLLLSLKRNWRKRGTNTKVNDDDNISHFFFSFLKPTKFLRHSFEVKPLCFNVVKLIKKCHSKYKSPICTQNHSPTRSMCLWCWV